MPYLSLTLSFCQNLANISSACPFWYKISPKPCYTCNVQPYLTSKFATDEDGLKSNPKLEFMIHTSLDATSLIAKLKKKF